MESEVNDTLVRHVFKDNNLVSDKQWAFRSGYSTELLLTHLTETWRTALDSGKAVAVAFIDFNKAFDSVSHDILETKLNRDFGFTGTLFDWLKSYLRGRQQFTVLNGVKSEPSQVSFDIPHGSVLGPTLFTLFTNDLPDSVSSGSLYMYADDTTAYCIGDLIDIAIAQLIKALKEVYTWCLTNRLTPHPGKSEVMLLSKGTLIGPHAPIQLGTSILRCVTKTRLLGITVDRNLSWVPHALETKKSFANKLNLLKRSRFLPKGVLKEFYFKVILPSVKYGLVLWGSCCNSDMLDSIERLHCRAARIIFNLPKDMPSNDVLKYDQWLNRELYFPSYYFFADRRLKNHRIKTEHVMDMDFCELLCYQHDDCVSFNIKKDPDSATGQQECEFEIMITVLSFRRTSSPKNEIVNCTSRAITSLLIDV
ncbi:hypothetical protein ACROYT_G023335 [Oculina patagonica]